MALRLTSTIGSLSDRGKNQMIGTFPTVGCLVFLHRDTPKMAVRQVLSALDTFVKVYRQKDERWLIHANIEGEQMEGLIFTQPGNDECSTVVFVEFDEEATVLLARRNGKALDRIFLPFVSACENLLQAKAVGIGFETSVPTGFDDHSLESAGIAVLYEKNQDRNIWSRRDIYRLTGHTEQSLAHV